MGSRGWSALVACSLVITAAIAWQMPIGVRAAGASTEGQNSERPSKSGSASLFAAAIAGRASCSGRACHGSLEPVQGGNLRQNEFTTWVRYDKHARAFDVLTGERGRRIARNLGIANAAEDARCLACHTTPALAGPIPEDLVALRSDGVGCEACHGPAKGAKPWLAVHTLAIANSLPRQVKLRAYQERGMTPLFDLEAQAKTCAGCHVGAPADPEHGIPARDLNHDLMAAGHPRLMFELGTFRDNMPPHWRRYQHETPGYEASVWAVGQVASALAATELLAHRAELAKDAKAPWPEFAESSCFACHADLKSPSWRRNAEYYSGRKPGAIPANRWYSALLPALEGVAPGKAGAADKALTVLAAEMNKPYPDPKKVRTLATAASTDLGTLLTAVKLLSFDPSVTLSSSKLPDIQPVAVKSLAEGISRQAGSFKVPDWDEATQSALAGAAVRVAGGPNPVPDGLGPLDDIFRELAFPPSYESPEGYTPYLKPDGQAEDLRTRLLKALEGIAHRVER